MYVRQGWNGKLVAELDDLVQTSISNWPGSDTLGAQFQWGIIEYPPHNPLAA